MRLTRSASGYNIGLKGEQRGISILLRELSLRPSPGQLTDAIQSGDVGKVFRVSSFAERFVIRRYPIARRGTHRSAPPETFET